MNQIWHFVKLAASVLTGFAALVCIFVAAGLVLPLSAVSIAFSVMPE